MRNKQDIAVNTNTSQWNFSNCRTLKWICLPVFSHHQKEGVDESISCFFPQTLPAWHNSKPWIMEPFPIFAMYIHGYQLPSIDPRFCAQHDVNICHPPLQLLRLELESCGDGRWKLHDSSRFFLVVCKVQSQPWNDMNHESYWLVQVRGY